VTGGSASDFLSGREQATSVFVVTVLLVILGARPDRGLVALLRLDRRINVSKLLHAERVVLRAPK
jgi:hypothetical protein